MQLAGRIARRKRHEKQHNTWVMKTEFVKKMRKLVHSTQHTRGAQLTVEAMAARRTPHTTKNEQPEAVGQVITGIVPD
eukprot:6213011-Pleurochrysis_carterae.AAC.3